MDPLDELLRGAKDADGSTRIEFRDRVAEFGVAAVGRLEARLGDPRLAPFAVRTIERAAAQPGAGVVVLAIGSVPISTPRCVALAARRPLARRQREK